MKKQAILKMIDTFIRDLKEIRKDVEKFEVSEDTESYTQYTDDELAAFIAKTLEGRNDSVKADILNKVAELENINKPQIALNDLTEFDVACRILDNSKYEYGIRPRKSSNGGKVIVLKNKYNGAENVAIGFNEKDKLVFLDFDKDLYIEKH